MEKHIKSNHINEQITSQERERERGEGENLRSL